MELGWSGLIGAAVLGAILRRVRGTTLVAPVVWSGLSWLALMIGEQIALHASISTAPIVRYVAAVSTFCAPMALLGAKRPQDRGWQFIVASLWLVLCVPAIQLIILTPSGTLELHLAWRVLLGALILVGVTNYLPTRFGWAAISYGIAQWLLVGLGPDRLSADPRATPWFPFGCLMLSAVGPLIQASWSSRHGTGWNRVWIDFRDAFGCVWALRVSERMNQAATQAKLSMRFTWQGLVEAETANAMPAEEGPEWPSNGGTQELGELEVTIRQLLRRFVSAEWIDARMLAHERIDAERSG